METLKYTPIEHIDWVLDSIRVFINQVKRTSWDIIVVRDLQDNFTNVREIRRRLISKK